MTTCRCSRNIRAGPKGGTMPTPTGSGAGRKRTRARRWISRNAALRSGRPTMKPARARRPPPLLVRSSARSLRSLLDLCAVSDVGVSVFAVRGAACVTRPGILLVGGSSELLALTTTAAGPRRVSARGSGKVPTLHWELAAWHERKALGQIYSRCRAGKELDARVAHAGQALLLHVLEVVRGHGARQEAARDQPA